MAQRESHFLAPEIFNAENFDQRVDIYSLGILVYYLLSAGLLPHENFDRLSSYRKSQNDELQQIITEGDDTDFFSPLAKEFLKACLHKDPKLRPTAKELLEHPWLLKEKKEREMHREKLSLLRNRVIKQILHNLPWLKGISEHELTVYRTMCDYDLLADEHSYAEKHFEIFDMRRQLDGRLEFDELKEVCEETNLIEN